MSIQMMHSVTRYWGSSKHWFVLSTWSKQHRPMPCYLPLLFLQNRQICVSSVVFLELQKIAKNIKFGEEDTPEFLPMNIAKPTNIQLQCKLMTAAIWRIYARLKLPLYPELSKEKINDVDRGKHVFKKEFVAMKK